MSIKRNEKTGLLLGMGGIVMLIIAFAELATWSGATDALSIISSGGDVMIGMLALMTAFVFLSGLRTLLRREGDEDAFLLVGSMLCLIIAIVGILIMSAESLQLHVLGETEIEAEGMFQAIWQDLMMLGIGIIGMWFSLKIVLTQGRKVSP